MTDGMDATTRGVAIIGESSLRFQGGKKGGACIQWEFVMNVSSVRPSRYMPMLHKAITVPLRHGKNPFVRLGALSQRQMRGRQDAPIRADMKKMPRKLEGGLLASKNQK